MRNGETQAMFHPSPRFATAVVSALVALAVLAPAVRAADGKPPPAPPMKVAVDAVITEPLNQTVPVIGRLVGRATGLAARVEGSIAEIRADVGNRVAKGDAIAVLVDDQYKWDLALRKAEVQQFTAIVKAQKSKVTLRRQELSRLERLKESAAFSQARLEDKRQEMAIAASEAAEAEGRLASARANLGRAETNLANTLIRAPFAGIVAKRMVEVGTYVKIGDPLMNIVDDSGFEVEAEIPSQYAPALPPETRVAVSLANGASLTARVRAVVPSEDPQSRTRTTRFVPEASPDPAKRPPELRNLADNQSVTIHVPTARAGNVVTVHKDAVLIRSGGRVVYLVKGSEALARSVILGDAIGSRFVVRSGLQPGDLVVVRGNERLLPGQKVQYDAAKPKSDGKADDGGVKDAERAPAPAKQG
jgi:RND family efflux transporter MFP subunit